MVKHMGNGIIWTSGRAQDAHPFPAITPPVALWIIS